MLPLLKRHKDNVCESKEKQGELFFFFFFIRQEDSVCESKINK